MPGLYTFWQVFPQCPDVVGAYAATAADDLRALLHPLAGVVQVAFRGDDILELPAGGNEMTAFRVGEGRALPKFSQFRQRRPKVIDPGVHHAGPVAP